MSREYYWSDKEVLLTGGSGFLCRNLTILLLQKYKPKGIRIFNRNEESQRKFRVELENLGLKDKVSFLIGDVRDRYRLEMAMRGVNIVISAAALKQVPACLENPREAVYTNILGSQNVVDCAINCKIEKAILVSSDKATKSSTFYGSTKSVAEGLFVYGNTYSAGRKPYFSCVRYGNVLSSTGSCIPLFLKQVSENGYITITDKRMTRFWWRIEQAAEFILSCVESMKGKEIFIPKIGSSSLMDLVDVVVPGAEIKEIGIRANEKLDEELISIEESRNVVELKDKYIIHPKNMNYEEFTLTSKNNPLQLTKEDLKKLIG